MVRISALVSSGLITLGVLLLVPGIVLLIIGMFRWCFRDDCTMIRELVREGLLSPERGNPLHLREGQLLPSISCTTTGNGSFDLTISTVEGVPVDTLTAASNSVTASLTGKFQTFGVSNITCDVSGNAVTYRIEDLEKDYTLVYSDVHEMRSPAPTLIPVDKRTYIDLVSSGSMLVCGKTRSGKTTGVIALLLTVLLHGPDKYHSRVDIIDPKRAELSVLPYVTTLDEDGGCQAILHTVERFEQTIILRQQILNDLSVKTGNVVTWYNAGMSPSFLFIDEFVSCRTLFPTKITKGDDCNLTNFDNLPKRIITMGASAGCFAIISIAEASVVEGGLPAMLRAAMSTRVLFRPTAAEGRLIWDKARLEQYNDNRYYAPGDAWFSSTDGEHEDVSVVHFPVMEFPVYRCLGEALRSYYDT